MNIFNILNNKTSEPIKEPINDVSDIEHIKVVPQFEEIVNDMQSIYDDAHKKVMRDLIRTQVKNSLISYVIGKDVLDETKQALSYYKQLEEHNYKIEDKNNKMTDEDIYEIVLKKFPNAHNRTIHLGYSYNTEFSASVNIGELVNKIVEDIIK